MGWAGLGEKEGLEKEGERERRKKERKGSVSLGAFLGSGSGRRLFFPLDRLTRASVRKALLRRLKLLSLCVIGVARRARQSASLHKAVAELHGMRHKDRQEDKVVAARDPSNLVSCPSVYYTHYRVLI